MYLITLDLSTKNESQNNPEYLCHSLAELVEMIDFFFKNGHDVLFKEVEGK